MRTLMLIAMLVGGTNVALADNQSFYVGAGLTWDHLGAIEQAGVLTSSIDQVSWRLLAGWRPIHAFALEASYADLGNHTATANVPPCSECACPLPIYAPLCGGGTLVTRVSARESAIYAVGFLPLTSALEGFGKVGVAHWTQDSQWTATCACAGQPPPYPMLTAQDSTRGNSLAWGAGMQIASAPLTWRLEYEGFAVSGTSGARVASLDVIYAFR
jgi:opacity protein-like surface antigen